MRIVFSKIFTDSQESYIREKLKRSLQQHLAPATSLEDPSLAEHVANVVRSQLGTPVPLAAQDAHPPLTPEQEAQIEARKRCALATLRRKWPLLEGENVKEDFFTFLQEPFCELPAQTALLRRTTSMAELYYLFDEVLVVGGDLSFAKPAASQPARRLLTSASSSQTLVQSIVTSMASGIVSGIGGKVGALIFDAIFPPGVPSYFDEVYKEITKIVRQEVAANTIEEINGRINGTVAWLRNTYKPRKEANASREELSEMVRSYVDRLYMDAVYTLMEPNLSKAGLTVFMVAAQVHLGLMQEQALVDPSQPDPDKSSHATSVKLNAQEYYNHVTKTVEAILADRREAVEIMYNPFVDCIGNSCVTKGRYAWHDKLTGESGDLHEDYRDEDKNFHSGREKAEAERQEQLERLLSKLTEDMGKPQDIANQWLSLKTRPIPDTSEGV